MTHYLIEYRFQGKVKSDIKQMIGTLDSRFLDRGSTSIPHISLAGPLETNDEAKLIKDFTSLCKNSPFCSFKVNGFGFFERTKVVFININPSEKLKDFRWKLAQKIMKYCTLRDYDYKEDFEFHATLAMKLDNSEFSSIKKFIEQQKSPRYKHFLIRATIIKNSKILCEYDFLQRRLLTREEALSRNQLATTMKLLKDFFDGKYDPDQNLTKKPNVEPKQPPKSKKDGIIDKIAKTLNKFINKPITNNKLDSNPQGSPPISPHPPISIKNRDKMTLREQRISNGMELTHPKHHSKKTAFVISDLHLEHENIISYCKRPFNSVQEMDEVLIKNWNYIVKPDDTVYFVGDMTIRPTSSDKYIPVLNGNIYFIWGNHDITSDPDGNYESLPLSYKGIEFLFVHNPIDIPKKFEGWAIYGHHHNNNIKKYPFFDPEKKRINVGVELVKYQPVSLDYIVSLITEGHEKITSL